MFHLTKKVAKLEAALKVDGPAGQTCPKCGRDTSAPVDVAYILAWADDPVPPATPRCSCLPVDRAFVLDFDTPRALAGRASLTADHGID